VAWLIFCSVLGSESATVFALPVLLRVAAAAVFMVILALLVGLASPTEFVATLSYLRASRRWRNHHCPVCDHPMAPGRFDGPCQECGARFARPQPPVRGVGRRTRLCFSFVLAALVLAAVWHETDRYRFQAEVAQNPTIRHARPRWWPARSAGFVYEPGSGITAHD
jgi:hypothetical protein